MDIGKDVWSTVVVVGIKLRSQRRVEGEREDDFAGAHELLRVLQRDAPLEVIAEVVYGAELSRASIRNAHVNVGVFTQGQSQIGGHGGKSIAVRRFQTPRVSAQELPLSALQVQPIEAQTIGVAIRGNKYVGRIVAVEVAFNIPHYVVRAVLATDLQVVARILASGAKFCQVSLHCVAEWNRAETGGA